MILTQIRIAIAFTLVTALAALSGEPDRPHFVEQRIVPAITEDHLGTFHNSSVWLEEMSQPVRRRDLIREASASCGASACHGGPRPGIAEDLAARGAEYPLWLENDPHAQSWRTLCNERSIAMLERLRIVRGGKIVNPEGFENCLACHNSTGGYVPSSASSNSVFHGEGVGCASCHGPSQNWRSDHFRVQRDNSSNASVGLVPNKDLFIRARVCASCHVGDSDRDMNHDIIAAGHPALHYEFATFHNRLPKHWREPEQTLKPDFEAKLWLAGQVAALDASLALLESRAGKRLSISTWPEFAATDCSACHQSLRMGETEVAGAPGHSKSSFSNWNRFGVDQLLRLSRNQDHETSDARRLALSLDNLSKLMATRAIPEAAAVEVAARIARQDLDAWIENTAKAEMQFFSVGNLQSIAEVSLADNEELNRWEFAAQAYLAAIAARNSWMDSANPAAVSYANQLRLAILFKPGSNSLALLDEPNRNIQSTAASLSRALQQFRHVPRLPDTSASISSREQMDLQLQLQTPSFSD